MVFLTEPNLGVVPVLVGPLQILVAILPGLMMAIGGTILALFRPAVLKGIFQLLWRMKLQLLALVAVVIGVIYFGSLIFPGSLPAEQESSAYDWRVFRGGPRRPGWVAQSPSPNAGGINWLSDTEDQSFFCSAAVVGNRVYVSSVKLSPFGQGSGAIYCLDADSGRVVWKHRPSGYRPTFSSPSVYVSADGRKYLVVGEGLHLTRDARVICLDITDETDVKTLWEYRTASHVESSPAIAQGRVYIGAGDDGYYCFELEADSQGQAQVVWHVGGDKYPDAETCPVVQDGRVYVGLGVKGNAICKLDGDSGQEIWRVETPYPVFGPPSVAKGRVFVGMGNGNLVETAEEIMEQEIARLGAIGASQSQIDQAKDRLAAGGEVWGIDIEDPSKRWVIKVARAVLGAVVASGESLYFATRGGEVYRVSYEGEVLAKWNAHVPIVASPACSDKYVYVVTAGGTLYALDRKDLSVEWELGITSGGRRPFMSSPVIARGSVYVGTQNDGVVSVGEPAGEKEQLLWSGHLGGPGRGGNIDKSTLPEKVAKLWPKKKPKSPAVVTAPAAALEGVLYVPLAGGARTGLVCLENPPQARADLKERWFFSTPNGVEQSPAASTERVFLVDGKRGDRGRRLYCLAVDDGEELWSVEVASEASGSFGLFADGLCVEDEPGKLTFFELDGSVGWEFQIGPMVGVAAGYEDILVVCAKEPARLVGLDSQSGKVLWESNMEAVATTSAAIDKKSVFVGSVKGIEAHNLLDGSLLWSTKAGAVESSFVLGRDYIVLVNDSSKLVLIDRNNGSLVLAEARAEEIPRARKSVGPIVVGNSIVYATDTSLVRLKLGPDPKAKIWMDVSWLGAITSPIIVSESKLYFGTDKYGFVRVGQW